MSNRSAAAYFDDIAFRADVIGYLDHWKLSGRALARKTDLSAPQVAKFINGASGAGLLMACALADVCDLSLDKYRRRP